jgi:lipopolysaccharide export system ATP-binding protein
VHHTITCQNTDETPTEGLFAQALCKGYRNRPVLDGVSIHVSQGEAVALLGANGVGKSTCFYLITGLLKPDSGRIFLDGRDVTNLSLYRRAAHGLGYLPQESSIFRGLDVEKNIRAALQLHRLYGSKQDARLEKLLHDFSIGHIRHTPATALSGGERRRVEIARALAAEPRFILLDEPLAGVDPLAVADIRKLITQLKREGIGVLITDHNVRDTLGIVDRAYVLNNGRILHEGTPAEIATHEAVRNVYLGDDFSL